MKKKIVFVAGFYPEIKGGAEYQMRIIADTLKKDFDIVFLYIGDVPTAPVDSTHIKNIDGYKVYFVKTSGKYDRFMARYLLSRRIKKILKNEAPNFVYQRVYKFMSYYLAMFQKKLNYKLYIHISDLYSINNISDLNLRGKVKKYIFNKIVASKAKFVVQTKEQKKILIKLGEAPILQIYNLHPVVYCDIDIETLKKQKSKIKQIVWIANIRRIKRLELFIELAEHFIHDKQIHFTIIGNITDNLYAEPLVEKINNLENITHHTDKDNVFVNKFIEKKAHLVVNTSETEGFSNVYIQTWLKGVPVFSLNSNPDTIFDKYPIFGKYFNDSLIDLKNELIPYLYRDNYIVNAKCRSEIAMENFSIKNNIDKLLKLFK